MLLYCYPSASVSNSEHFSVKLMLGEFYKTVEFIIFFKFLLAIAGTLVGMHGTPRFQLNPSWKTTD